jgi:hypothetical protein
MQRRLLLAAVLVGLIISFIDTRPKWDDAGITVLAFLIGSGLIGLLTERRPWLYALAVGIWLPLWYLITAHTPIVIVVLVFPFIGEYVGWALRLGLKKNGAIRS